MTHLPHVFIGSAIAFGSGLLPRAGLAVYTIGWSYLNLCDASRYVNHYYLYALLGALLLLAALDVHVRRVHVLLLRAQWSLAYFFAGCAKCSAEFVIRREPLRSYMKMAVRSGAPLDFLAGLLDAEPTVALAAAFAIIFDAGAAFALWYRPTFRPWCVLAAAFHMTNALIFRTIGSFPFVSLASCLLFAEMRPAAERRSLRGACSGSNGFGSAARRGALTASLAAWLTLQAILPLRHHFLSGDVAWTKLGNEFAWRMMADTTDGWVDVTLTALPANRTYRIYPQSDPPASVTLTSHSITQLLASPGLLQQYILAEVDAAAAALLRRGEPEQARSDAQRLRVHAECWKSVNGRPYQRYCDPTFDFGAWSAHSGRVSAGAGGDGAGGPRAFDGLLRAALGDRTPGWAAPPPWMLPRVVGPAGAPSVADGAANDAASRWRAKGYTVEAFVDAAGRPAWRDRILRSSGYREARLLCTHGELAVLIGVPAGGGAAAAHRATGKPPSGGWTRLIAGEWATLSIGIAHELRNVGDRPTSWVYAMR